MFLKLKEISDDFHFDDKYQHLSSECNEERRIFFEIPQPSRNKKSRSKSVSFDFSIINHTELGCFIIEKSRQWGVLQLKNRTLDQVSFLFYN